MKMIGLTGVLGGTWGLASGSRGRCRDSVAHFHVKRGCMGLSMELNEHRSCLELALIGGLWEEWD